MVGAPKGNKNALKHGLYAVRGSLDIVEGASGDLALQVRGPAFAVQHLEVAVEEIFRRMMTSDGDEFAKLANALSLATTALFNGHRTMAFLMGGMSPLEDALRELEALNFEED